MPRRANWEEPPHGTHARYQWKGNGQYIATRGVVRCSCAPCVAAATEYRRVYHLKNYEARSAKAREWRNANRVVLREKAKERKLKMRARCAAIKMERGCVDCGYKGHPAALDFDHLPQFEKSFGIAVSASRSWENLLAEINKCEVVCANCHRIRTVNRRDDWVVNV